MVKIRVPTCSLGACFLIRRTLHLMTGGDPSKGGKLSKGSKGLMLLQGVQNVR